MEAQQEVIVITRQVNGCIGSLRTNLDKKNTRLVQKYVPQLESLIDNLLHASVSAEMSVGPDEPCLVESRRVDELARSILSEGEEYLLEIEENAVSSATKRVNDARMTDLLSSLSSFKDSLDSPANKAVEDVDKSKQVSVMRTMVKERREQMVIYQKQKISLISEMSVSEHKLEIQNLEDLYKSVSIALNTWCDNAAKHFGEKIAEVSAKSGKEVAKSPGLKLDRLALPVFRGNMRNYARFVMEFDNTLR